MTAVIYQFGTRTDTTEAYLKQKLYRIHEKKAL